jgi:hypothetical protein
LIGTQRFSFLNIAYKSGYEVIKATKNGNRKITNHSLFEKIKLIDFL